jgi:hypothetical protein
MEKTDPKEIFRQLVCLGWYDGPISGMLSFQDESVECRFDLVDDAATLAFRVFSITPLPNGTIDRFVEMMHHYGHKAPNWPIWVPVWHFPTELAADEARYATDELLKTQFQPTAAFCWNLQENRIIAYRKIIEKEPKPDDWFSWLGLNRPGQKSVILEKEQD